MPITPRPKFQSFESSNVPALSESDLAVSLGRNSFERGRDYYARGAVISSEYNSDRAEIRAQVRGTQRAPYTVEISLMWTGSTWMIDGECSCPMGFNCKHVAATLFSLITSGGKQSSNPLSPEIASWIRDLKNALAPPSEVRAKTNPQLVLYLLKLADWHNPPRPRISLYVTKKLKSGGFAAGREKDFSQLVGRSFNLLATEDYEIANLMLFGSRYSTWYDGTLPDSEELCGLLLTKLIASGRCHFLNAQNPPLTLGESRPAQIVWAPRSDGKQVPQVVVDANAAIIWGAKPWYVDKTSWLAGPAELPLPVNVAEVILMAPSLSAQEVSKVYTALGTLPTKLKIPLPKTDKEIEMRKITPIKHLKLSTEWRKNSSEPIHSKAELTFDYGQYKFPPNQSHLEIEEAGKTVILQPDRAAEDSAVADLNELGLIDLPSSSVDPSKEFISRHNDESLGWLQFSENITQLTELGWQVDIDSSFGFHAISYDGEWQYDVQEDESPGWFSLDLGIEFEGQRISLLPILMKALENLRGTHWELSTLNVGGKFFVRIEDGRLLGLPFERVEKILKFLIDLYDSKGNKAKITLAQALDFAAVEQSILEGCSRLRKIADRLKDCTGVSQVSPPVGLGTTLRSYQADGFSWLQFIAEFNLGGILADDMGLGKTVQTIAHMLAEKQNKKLETSQFLIVCPTSVVPNWMAELERFAPQLKTVLLHGGKRSEKFDDIPTGDVIVTSYPLLIRDLGELKKHQWHGVILDEAQNIKNPATKMAQSACALKAEHRICLTGTPVENHLGELWSQFHFLNPGMLGNPRVFSEVFRVPIEKEGDIGRQKLLASRIKPFMIRRTKLEVEKDLPPKTIIVKPALLEGPQRDLYELIRISMHKKVQNAIAMKGLARSQIAIFRSSSKIASDLL
jgi:hypothetical protein